MRGMKASFAGLLLVAGAFGAREARAFVRETSSYTNLTPLHWSSGCVVLAVADPQSPDLSWTDLLTATQAAADTWTRAAAGCGSGFSFVVHLARAGLGVGRDGVNAILIHWSNYCGSRGSSPGCDPLSLAATSPHAVDHAGAADDGRIYEADVEINGEAYSWGLVPQGGEMDLQGAITHELGHVLGLDHNCYESGFGLPRPVDDQGVPVVDCAGAPTDVTAAIMYPGGDYSTERRTLSSDDVRGICSIYPAGTPPACQGSLTPSGGCSVGDRDPGGSSIWTLGGLGGLLLWLKGRGRSVARHDL